ncbi:hypothetical protein BDN71DRAFT_230574 [Pleurotus eryngii]|uniref:Uncharacterized protein n=1 Tax=Pleurotus eryngii TaxID=5323 RepID=A0A9P6DIF6_PLEER|nr:hypothetical protein BDN71DRAFT_230574 [Pleurotus eryngii]
MGTKTSIVVAAPSIPPAVKCLTFQMANLNEVRGDTILYNTLALNISSAEGSPTPNWAPNGQDQSHPPPWSQHHATAQQGPFEHRGNVRLENCGWKNVGNTNSTFVESNDRTAYTSGDYYNNPQDPINTYRTPGGTQNVNSSNGVFNNIAGSQTFHPIDGQRVNGYPNPWQNQYNPRATPKTSPLAQSQNSYGYQVPAGNGNCYQQPRRPEACSQYDSHAPAGPSRYNPRNPYNAQMYGPSSPMAGPTASGPSVQD